MKTMRVTLLVLLAGLLLILSACSEDPALDINPYLNAEDGSWSETEAGLALQALPKGESYLSDLPWRSAKNGWGPVEKDRSNGTRKAGDGRALTLNGQTFKKGLGVHANSELVYTLDEQCSRFSAKVGLDDEIDRQSKYGSVVFRVFADGKEVFNSGVMRGNSKTKTVNVNVSGAKRLRLVVGTAEKKGERGYDWFDHANWADAKLRCGDAPGPKPGAFNGYHVQAVYILPRNAPQRNRSALMLEATRKIQRQWAGWNWTFDLKPNIITLNLPETCGYYSARPRVYERIHPHVTAELKRRGLFSEKAKYVLFAECIREDGVAAWGGGNRATMLEGVLNKIQLNDGSSSNRSAIGAIGHELGHTFGFPHENCSGNNPSNGRPPSNGPMCNGKGNWPNVSPAPYQRDLLRQKGCNWIAECTRASQQGLGSQAVTHDYVDDEGTFVDDDGNIIWRD